MYRKNTRAKFNEVFNESNPHYIQNEPIRDIFEFIAIIIIALTTLAIVYLLTIVLGISVTLMIWSNEYSIHTGCKYNDTVYSNNNTKHTRRYCISSKTGGYYNKIGCATNYNNDVSSECFITGAYVVIGIAIIAFVIIGSILLWNGKKIIDNRSIKDIDTSQNDEDDAKLESETST